MGAYDTAPESSRRIAKILLTAAAVFAIAGTVHWTVLHNKILSCTTIADGTVTGVTKAPKLIGSQKYKWDVSFTAEDGAEYTFRSSKTDRAAEAGDEVDVLYDPHKPTTAIVSDYPPDGGMAEYVCAGISLVAAVICLSRKQKPQPAES